MATVNCILVGQTPCAEVFYIDLEGSYPDYTCPVAMADIKAAYEAGKVLECRCAVGPYTATLPLFIPMPSANTWIFSGSGELTAMNFAAQSLTIAIVNGAVQASRTRLVSMAEIPTIPDVLPNPCSLFINSGSNSVAYDGSMTVNIDIPTALPNPNALTLTSGSNSVTYDGSTPKNIDIPAGKSAYASAQDGGYTGTEAQFNTDLAAVGGKQAKITASGLLKGDGTGGVSAAVKGMDYAGISETVTATLLAASWTGSSAPYTYTLAVNGVTANSNQELLPALTITEEQLTALQAANIQDGGQAANSVTLTAFGDKPTIDLPIRVIVRGDS